MALVVLDHVERISQPVAKADCLKSIFPPGTHLERFKHLENARESGKRDLALDTEVLSLIHRLESQVKDNSSKNESYFWHR